MDKKRSDKTRKEVENLRVHSADKTDLPALAGLGVKLWPTHTPDDLQAEFAETLRQPDAAFFLAVLDAQPVGFAQCGLRYDYVEGTDSSPVGYLEGVYVEPEWRRTGVATRLVAACENWARAKGCAEFASDCELDNIDSLRFHLGAGFAEANRIICFTKRLS